MFFLYLNKNMKLICPKNKKYVLYPHIFVNNESWGYCLTSSPPIKNPLLFDWQVLILINSLQNDALRKNLLLRH